MVNRFCLCAEIGLTGKEDLRRETKFEKLKLIGDDVKEKGVRKLKEVLLIADEDRDNIL